MEISRLALDSIIKLNKKGVQFLSSSGTSQSCPNNSLIWIQGRLCFLSLLGPPAPSSLLMIESTCLSFCFFFFFKKKIKINVPKTNWTSQPLGTFPLLLIFVSSNDQQCLNTQRPSHGKRMRFKVVSSTCPIIKLKNNKY